MTTDTPTYVPQRVAYFALILADADLNKPAQIMGWPTLNYDEGTPPPQYDPPPKYKAFYLPNMTAEHWDELRFKKNGLGGGIAYFDGDMVPYTPPPYVPPLKEQATAAMQTVQQQASMASAMGETFGPQMQAYVKQLRAIISGSDTTSTELPQAPDEVSS